MSKHFLFKIPEKFKLTEIVLNDEAENDEAENDEADLDKEER